MLKTRVITLIALSLFLVAPAFAGNKGNGGDCKDQKVTGSYNRVIDGTFSDGYGVVIPRTYLRQLNLNAGGTVNQQQSTPLDGAINVGAHSSWLGSWECRKDGKLLVNVLHANYEPIPAGAIFPGSHEDLYLLEHLRTTYLFTVEDNDTLKLIQAVARFYDMTEDPTDPNAGTLGTEDFDEYLYKRLKPSDADLTP